MTQFTSLSQLLTLLLILAMGSSANAQDDPIKALLITGGGWHDYEAQEKLLTEGINERLGDQIEWTIIHEGDGAPDHQVAILKQEDWAKDYDVVVHNTGFGRVRDADFVTHFVEHHKGTPAVLIHAAIHSYRYSEPADPWFEFMGLQSMMHESQNRFEVENVAPEHPIMGGFPKTFPAPKDEVYVVEKIWGDITPLARAFGEETEEYQPVIWTHEVDSTHTRVFATTLGHNNATFEQEAFLSVIANGLLWTVERL